MSGMVWAIRARQGISGVALLTCPTSTQRGQRQGGMHRHVGG